MRRLVVIGWLAVACNFSGHAEVSDAPIPDAPVSADVAFVTLAVTRPAGKAIVVMRLRDETGVMSMIGCVDTKAPSMYAIRDLVPHPSLPLVYEVENGFHAISLACSGLMLAGATNVGTARALERIVVDPAVGVGFFTMDGSGALNVFRFTTTTDGSPTVTGPGTATSQAGPLVFDSAADSLFVAGPGIVSYHAVVGPTYALPVGRVNTAGCASPVDLVATGDTILEFCADVPEIRRYIRTPAFAYDKAVGTLGNVDRVVRLPGDRAIAALQAPPGIALISLVSGSPTWSTTSLAARTTVLAASPDGTLLVTEQPGTGTTTDLMVWRITPSSLEMLTTTTIDGTLTAAAVTNPGT